MAGDILITLPLFMGKIINRDIFAESVDELEKESREMKEETRLIDKTAFNLNIDPASLVGSITGGLLAKYKINKNQEEKEWQQIAHPPIETGYYSQVNNMVDNLKVIFTPLSAVYVLKNGPAQTTIETIGTDEMNDSMYNAWQAKSHDYFKTLMLNKMHGELQFVEQQFAKRILENQLKIKESITKKANYVPQDMSIVELVSYVDEMKTFYGNESELTNKVASILESLSDFPKEVITPRFKRPIEKYASFAQPLSFLGITIGDDDVDSLQGSYLNPSYLNNRIKIGFLPDRVVFIVDNKVIKSLLAMDMNSESFDMFKKQAEGYFEKMFKKELEDGIKRMQGELPQDLKKPIGADIIKTASYDIFFSNRINPLIYDKVLTSKYGSGWIDWDLSALLKSIEMDFTNDKPVWPIPMNKIYSIHVMRNNTSALKYPHLFEKVIRTFSDKHIDFMSDEREDVTAADILMGLDTMELVVDYNIYKEMTVDVKNYIVKCLYQDSIKVFFPAPFINSKLEEDFYTNLNNSLLSETISRDCSGITDNEIIANNVKNNEIINRATLNLLNTIFTSSVNVNIKDMKALDPYLAHYDKGISDIIKMQVKNNLIMNEYVNNKRAELDTQDWNL